MTLHVDHSMTRKIVTIGPETSPDIARRIMKEANFRHLPVINQDGSLVGILSDRDLLSCQNCPSDADSIETVEQCMTPNPLTCTKDISMQEVAKIMIDRKIDCLPIVEGGELVGLITSTDLLELLASGRMSDEPRIPWNFQFANMTPVQPIP
ncbi:CBS domain-containing protein [Pseudobacteriovorax antillogorgiicola]|uniref:CBS domain-containing protein n=1 Tax=Pseudobacteriovorax antillogorgiicola TaxID=1513793 RepID=A0A1Y6BM27_9BACT|nr:CBS domain-containing protein [Pseudobacteriovorax antillogorgiicola]TCS54613.1 CBS domain-containing protein [Pseudobacteriovorax antillogorgiicola]SMF17471.1 CBS domain-containing protein [Pseudobacteriovorax antillogorgiicola]